MNEVTPRGVLAAACGVVGFAGLLLASRWASEAQEAQEGRGPW